MVRLTGVQRTGRACAVPTHDEASAPSRPSPGRVESLQRNRRHAVLFHNAIRPLAYLPPDGNLADPPTCTSPGDASMDIDENLHRPEESGSADVTLVGRGVTVTASGELSSTRGGGVRPGGCASEGVVPPGGGGEAYWVGGG